MKNELMFFSVPFFSRLYFFCLLAVALLWWIEDIPGCSFILSFTVWTAPFAIDGPSGLLSGGVAGKVGRRLSCSGGRSRPTRHA